MESTLLAYPAIAAQLVALFEARFDPRLQLSEASAGRAVQGAGRGDRRRPRRGDQPRPGPDPALVPDADPGDAAHLVLPARRRTGRPEVLHGLQARPAVDPRPAGAAAEVRDLRLLAAVRGRAPALRRGRPRRPALVRPARGLPHRDPRPGQGADGEERRDRAGRRQGRLRAQAGARATATRPSPATSCSSRPCSTSPTTSTAARSSPPADVVRHDGDDPYLVVAADKGTATFSDIANEISVQYGFWLGDAFASGGSAGYDHKKMGITAKGAWESVKRHFRELGVDTQTHRLHRGRRRRHVRRRVRQRDAALAAHPAGRRVRPPAHLRRPATRTRRRRSRSGSGCSTCRARRGTTTTGRSSPPAAGSIPRTAKSIPLTPQARAALGIAATVTSLTPHELMHAILAAPVDLLWNGGIGTYVKASERVARRRRRQGQRRAPGQRRASCAPRSSARAATSA